jgi:hypothetical protein
MASSLVDSIFRGEKEEKHSLSNLFDPSVSQVLPGRPQHKTLPNKRPRQAKQEDTPAATSKKESKKRKKPRREKKEIHDKNEQGTTPAVAANKQQDASPFDDEHRTIFVGNLPLETTTRKSLKALFSNCGKVESVRLRGLPTTGVKLPPQLAGNQVSRERLALATCSCPYASYTVFGLML